jgi:hypothetical protein
VLIFHTIAALDHMEEGEDEEEIHVDDRYDNAVSPAVTSVGRFQ